MREKAYLWHDDVRPAPEGWKWARTNAQAKRILKRYNTVACSLDHDLGANPEDGVYAKGSGEETGLHLVEWMIENDLVPSIVIIHSWNIPGAHRMKRTFEDASHRVAICPFQVDGINPLYMEALLQKDNENEPS